MCVTRDVVRHISDILNQSEDITGDALLGEHIDEHDIFCCWCIFPLDYISDSFKYGYVRLEMALCLRSSFSFVLDVRTEIRPAQLNRPLIGRIDHVLLTT
jgi:hypothetical protein